MKHFIISLLLLLWISPSFANDRYNNIFARQELLHKSYRQTYLDLTDINRQESLKTWFRLFMKDPKNAEVFNKTMYKVRRNIMSKSYRQLLFYYMVTGQKSQAAQTVGLFLISSHTLLDNFVSDPQSRLWKPHLTPYLEEIVSEYSYSAVKDVEDCFREYISDDRGFNLKNADNLIKGAQKCLQRNSLASDMKYALRNLFYNEQFYGAPFPISFTGYVGGNSVKLWNQVPMSDIAIESLGQQVNLVLTAVQPDLNKPYLEMSVEDFKSIMPTPESAITDVFSRKEGFLTKEAHLSLGPINASRQGIFGRVLESIKDAEESVFIDLFWMGGSIGMNLAKELFKKVNQNPDFTVYIITDTENKFNYGPELDVIYNYMRAFSEKFTEKNFYIAPAHLNLKRTALPEFIDLLITNNVVNDVQNSDSFKNLLANDGFHLLAKSDHTKVFVIDGKNPEIGTAFVGSKNWTDSSGGVNFDEVAEVQGPATAVILNSFYYDTLEAYELDTQRGGVMTSNHTSAKFSEIKSFRQRVQKLMEGMDVLDRHKYKSLSTANIDVPYLERGTSVVAPAQNNIYGTEMSAIEQNIQLILGAKKQIIVDDQFLYDPSIIEALKVAKTKNNVEIYVMLESLKALDAESDVAAHIPNNLFVPELVKMGIPVKWQLTPERIKNAVLKDKNKYGNHTLSTTFHIKSLTVDGVLKENSESCNSEEPLLGSDYMVPAIITGSANKDVMTMSGGFREYQILAFDKSAVAKHDCLFWARWNDDRLSQTTDGLDFELPEQAHELGITDKETFLNTLRMVLFAPYNFTKDFFSN